MPDDSLAREVRAAGVRTLLVGSLRCPVCRKAELLGRQTACSPACRRQRSRQRETEARHRAVADVRAHLGFLRDSIADLEAAVGRLEEIP